MKRPGIKECIRDRAVELIREHPEGLRYSELHRKLRESTPSFNAGTINSSIWNLDLLVQHAVWKPSKGLYRHVAFKEQDSANDGAARAGLAAVRVREEVFYSPFADWLKNEAEEVTQAIPLGGNVFRDKWGTPDVIGKRESRRSDVIKGPTLYPPRSRPTANNWSLPMGRPARIGSLAIVHIWWFPSSRTRTRLHASTRYVRSRVSGW